MGISTYFSRRFYSSKWIILAVAVYSVRAVMRAVADRAAVSVFRMLGLMVRGVKLLVRRSCFSVGV